MKEILLDELDDNNSFFHFTKIENIKSISKTGLEARKGPNSDIANEPFTTVFFSKGKKGILENSDAWLKWFMYHAYNEDNMFGFYRQEKDVKGQVEKWYQEFYSRKYLEDTEKQERLFAVISKSMQRAVYLSLDLEPGNEFDYNDYDNLKVKTLKEKASGNDIRYKTSKEMYGSFSNIDSPIMDSWNMHTKIATSIPKEKIAQVVTKEGKKDMLSIVIDVYQQKKENEHYDLLDNFIKYVNEKLLNNQEEEIKEENINYKNEITELKKVRQEVIASSRQKDEQADLNSMINDYDQDKSSNMRLNPTYKKQGFTSFSIIILILLIITIIYLALK